MLVTFDRKNSKSQHVAWADGYVSFPELPRKSPSSVLQINRKILFHNLEARDLKSICNMWVGKGPFETDTSEVSLQEHAVI